MADRWKWVIVCCIIAAILGVELVRKRLSGRSARAELARLAEYEGRHRLPDIDVGYLSFAPEVQAAMEERAATTLALAGGRVMPRRPAADDDPIEAHRTQLARQRWLFQLERERERAAWARLLTDFEYAMTWERLVNSE